MNHALATPQSAFIPEITEQIEIIDSYIEAGYSYEDAHSLWEEDYNRGVLASQQVDHVVIEDETGFDLGAIIYNKAVSRGYSVTEAGQIAAQVNSLVASGNRQKAFSLYLNRLKG